MIDEKLIDQIEKKQLANIVNKIKEGKSLTSQEQVFLDKSKEQTDISFLSEEAVIRTAELVDYWLL